MVLVRTMWNSVVSKKAGGAGGGSWVFSSPSNKNIDLRLHTATMPASTHGRVLPFYLFYGTMCNSVSVKKGRCGGSLVFSSPSADNNIDLPVHLHSRTAPVASKALIHPSF